MHRERVRMRDMIVLLPGIIGSVLVKDGKDLWMPSYSAIFSALISRGKSLEPLMVVGDDDPALDDLGDGIIATKLIEDARLVPGFFKVDGYNRLSEMIRGNFDVEQGSIDLQEHPYPPANYFEFPYDWRRDNKVSARKLAMFVRQRLSEWRKYAGDQSQVILVAHSMGGLVARYYLEALEGWKDCKALITFGTPFRGSVKALNFLVNGCDVGPFQFTELAKSLTSIYQLLPIYRSVHADGDLRRIIDVEIPRFNHDAARNALAFHHELIDLIESRKRSGNHAPYVLSPVVGQYQPTLQSAELFEGELTVSERLPMEFDPLLAHGDGTVPYLSAIPPDQSHAHRNIFFPESHGVLHCNDQALDFLYGQLIDLQIQGLEDLRGPGDWIPPKGRAAISLRTPDFCLANEPLIIQAKILEEDKQPAKFENYDEELGSLKARIEPAGSHGESKEVVFRRSGDDWIATTRTLPPGTYRMTVQATRNGPLCPLPVHDIFQVAEM